MRKLILALVATSLLLMSLTPTFAQEEPTIADLVTQTAAGDPAEFSILLAAISAADPEILEALSNPETSLTVFAPTDAAFMAALEGLGMAAEDVLANQILLDLLLSYHVIPMGFSVEELVFEDGIYAATVAPDSPLWLAASDDGSVMINEQATVIAELSNLEASNGYVHAIDTVLIPPALMEMVEMIESIGDMDSSSGMMITDVVGSTEGLATLVTAIGAADPAVAEALGSDNALLTVFAPTDDAFAAVDPALLEAALADPELLTGVLGYHLVPGVLTSAGIVALGIMNGGESYSVLTIIGEPLEITAVTDSVSADLKVNGANITGVDFYADNGVIHTIDAVLSVPLE